MVFYQMPFYLPLAHLRAREVLFYPDSTDTKVYPAAVEVRTGRK